MRYWLLVCLLVGIAGAFCRPAAAQTYPPFTGKRLYPVGTGDTGYDAALAAIRRVEKTGRETYYLVVVRNTGPGAWATRDYTDELYRRWSQQAREARLPLDSDRHVLIVTAVENRQISIHAGLRLQNDLGFTGSTIDREVVQPVFIPYAKAGEIPRGLAALVPAIDQWLRRAEHARERERQAVLQGQRQERARLAAQIRAEKAALAKLGGEIERAGRAGLAIRSLEEERARITSLVERAELIAREQPRAAGETLVQAEAARNALRDALLQLSQRRTEVDSLRRHARERVAAARQRLEQARAAKLPVAELPAQNQQAAEFLSRAEEEFDLDYSASARAARAAADRADAVLAAVNEGFEQRERQQRHRYLRTRVIPGSVAAMLLLASLVGLAWRRWRHLRLKKAVTERLAAMMTTLVKLMERLEALTQRHRLLTGADPDYTAPITGKTLALYQEAEQTLGKAWSLWDALVAARSAIEALIERESRLGIAQLRKAEQRLGELERREELESLLESIENHLDRLNQAHEQARACLETLASQRETIRESLKHLEDQDLPTTPYDPSVQPIEAGAAEAEERLVGDPLQARETAGEAIQAAASLLEWLGRIREQVERRHRLSERLAALARAAAARRAEGFLLKEPNGDPDPLLAHAREERDGGWQQLAAGDDSGASLRLGHGETFAGRAEAVITGQVKARAFCQEALPARRQETDRLTGRLAAAHEAERALAAEFDRRCWTDVSQNCAAAERRLPEFRRVADEAGRLADVTTQHYFHASALLEELARNQQATEASLAAVEETLDRLRQRREQARAALPQAQEAVGSLERFLEANYHAVRRPAQDRLDLARQALTSARDGMLPSTPDWLTVAAQVEQAQSTADAGLQAAQEDVANFDRARQLAADAEECCAAADRFIRTETADRPAAAARLARARAALDQARDEMTASGADWAALGLQIEQATADAEAALQMAREDVRLAEAVRREIADAHNRLRRADRYYGHGIRGDVGSAAGFYQQAAAAMTALQYEQAIRLANDAAQAARAAERAAQAQVRAIEEALARQREEAERRRRWSESSSSSVFSSSSSSSSSFSSGSSSSSFSSGTSQSSW